MNRLTRWLVRQAESESIWFLLVFNLIYAVGCTLICFGVIQLIKL